MQYFFAFLTSVLAAFSFPNFIEKEINIHTAYVIYFAFVPAIFSALRAKDSKEIFLLPYFSAAFFYVLSLYWLKNVAPMGLFAPVGWFVLSFYLAIWFAVPVWASIVLYRKKGISIYFTMPAFLTISEYVREWFLTGFPLLTPAQALHGSLFLDGAVKTAGSHGANYLIYYVNVWIALLFSGIKPEIGQKGFKTAGVFILAFFIACIWGYKNNNKSAVSIKAAILQPDIDQNVEWDKRYFEETMLVFFRLIDEAKKINPDVYVWPETAFPGVLPRESKTLKAIGERSGGVSLIGSDDIQHSSWETLYFNSAFSVNEKGIIEGSYSKYHLVPFGEYIPLAEVFPFVKKVVRRYGYSGFTSGKTLEPVKAGMHKAGIMICYDALFPEIASAFARKGASYLAHLSYETWYGKTPASAQIFQNTALRAKETGLPVIRCVASGISGYIDPRGRIEQCAGLFERKACVKEIKLSYNEEVTPYVKYGDWLPILLIAVSFFYAVIRR